MDGEEEQQTVKEWRGNLLGGPPTFLELPSDKDMCSKSERCPLGLIDFAVPLNMVKPHPLNWFNRCVEWCVKEDIALMSSWCFANDNGDDMCGKNKRAVPLWTRVKNLFDEAQAKNPQEIGVRNVDSMKGRWKRLNKSVNKWIKAYRKAYGRKKSGMSLEDVEKEAQAIYEVSGHKFNNLLVFNEVMSKHRRWELKLDHDSTRFYSESEEDNAERGGCSKRSMTNEDGDDAISCHPETDNQEKGGSSKRSRTNEDGDYAIPSHPETPIDESSTIPFPAARDAATKKKGKDVTSQSSYINEVAAEIRALRLTRNKEVEVMSQLGRARIELELKKEQRKTMKMNQVLLNTLLTKDHLSPEDEEIKLHLFSVVIGK